MLECLNSVRSRNANCTSNELKLVQLRLSSIATLKCPERRTRSCTRGHRKCVPHPGRRLNVSSIADFKVSRDGSCTHRRWEASYTPWVKQRWMSSVLSWNRWDWEQYRQSPEVSSTSRGRRSRWEILIGHLELCAENGEPLRYFC